MIEIERPKIECVELTEDYGKFVVEPLERGFGTTLGNSLRRVLLSSLPGVAASSIKIDGVLHEFSTVEGVKEDVTEIVLNIKELCVKLHSEGAKKVIIDARGECEVKAGDIIADETASGSYAAVFDRAAEQGICDTAGDLTASGHCDVRNTTGYRAKQRSLCIVIRDRMAVSV